MNPTPIKNYRYYCWSISFLTLSYYGTYHLSMRPGYRYPPKSHRRIYRQSRMSVSQISLFPSYYSYYRRQGMTSSRLRFPYSNQWSNSPPSKQRLFTYSILFICWYFVFYYLNPRHLSAYKKGGRIYRLYKKFIGHRDDTDNTYRSWHIYRPSRPQSINSLKKYWAMRLS